MGWASGTDLGITLWDLVREYVPEEKRKEIATAFYNELCDLDADAWEGDSALELDAEIDYDY